MTKIVSKNNYILIFEKKGENIDCVVYEKEKPMSGQDVANELNISRSAVSQSLKRSIKKIYYYLKKRNKYYSTIEVISVMASMFNIKSDNEYKKFFKLFPRDIRSRFDAEAEKIGYCRA